MNLKDILKQQADIVERSNVSININRSMEWITLNDNSGAYFNLEGYEAYLFILELDQLVHVCQDIDLDTLEKAMAYKYLDCLE